MSTEESMIPTPRPGSRPTGPRRTTRREFLGTATAGAALGWAGCNNAPRFTGAIVGPDRALGHRLRDRDLPPPES